MHLIISLFIANVLASVGSCAMNIIKCISGPCKCIVPDHYFQREWVGLQTMARVAVHAGISLSVYSYIPG